MEADGLSTGEKGIRGAFQPISLASEGRTFVKSRKRNKPQKQERTILLNGERLLGQVRAL
jgi:hypothetical protein